MSKRASVLRSLATVERRDSYTGEHSRRVRQLAISIGKELGVEGQELRALGEAALFHDIGKLAIPDEILLKPTHLTEDEWTLMRGHSDEGARMVERIGLVEETIPAIRHHHERFDGTGYPDGLEGDAIPISARVIHLADALDSILSTRVYRAGRPPREALAEIRCGSGTQFCPACVSALVRIVARGELDDLGVPRRALVAAL